MHAVQCHATFDAFLEQVRGGIALQCPQSKIKKIPDCHL
jgi:hypothetical protein